MLTKQHRNGSSLWWPDFWLESDTRYAAGSWWEHGMKHDGRLVPATFKSINSRGWIEFMVCEARDGGLGL